MVTHAYPPFAPSTVLDEQCPDDPHFFDENGFLLKSNGSSPVTTAGVDEGVVVD